MLTAKSARKISDDNSSMTDVIIMIDEQIRLRASKGHTSSVVMLSELLGHDDIIVEILIENGYNASRTEQTANNCGILRLNWK